MNVRQEVVPLEGDATAFLAAPFLAHPLLTELRKEFPFSVLALALPGRTDATKNWACLKSWSAVKCKEVWVEGPTTSGEDLPQRLER